MAQSGDRGTVSEQEAAAGILPSHGISINLSPEGHGGRPHPVKHMSAPAYQSPIRHHRRAPSRSKGVKETLDARSHYGSSDDDGAAIHRINQYIIKQEIGRGSFGAVHLAEDQYGNEYAVKEFSKSRLRKRAQSNLLRKPDQARRFGPGHLAARMSFNSPLHRHASDLSGEENNSLSLIKEEIAIMKKLDHPNLVSLIEVLDDPEEDSLYMVLEMCKKGVSMKVSLEERAEPYTDDVCRCWFRDMILGIEYLHAQGIIHRDLKPDNCLITNDDVLKIVDFGVSEMFEKESDMATAKSAGSPAFMPPELCVVRHGHVSGRAADIWSMGVTLYSLRYGRIPFEKTGALELYECIRNDDIPLDGEHDPNFEDMMRKLLEKDPDKRITMNELRIHPWVTRNGEDLLLPAEENCAELVEPPNEIEMNHAITGNMGSVMVVVKAAKRFKDLLSRTRPAIMEGIFGRGSRIVAPPHAVHGPSRSVQTSDRKPVEGALTVEGVHRDILVEDTLDKVSSELERMDLRPSTHDDTAGGAEHMDLDTPSSVQTPAIVVQSEEEFDSDSPRPDPRHLLKSQTFPVDEHAKGHAHDPLSETLFLKIGPGAEAVPDADELAQPIVSESPGAVEENIYERAYQEEMQRILEQRGESAALHLTRRVDHIEDLRSHPNILASSLNRVRGPARRAGGFANRLGAGAAGGFSALVREAQARVLGAAAAQGEQEAADEEQTRGRRTSVLDGAADQKPASIHGADTQGGATEPAASAGAGQDKSSSSTHESPSAQNTSVLNPPGLSNILGALYSTPKT